MKRRARIAAKKQDRTAVPAIEAVLDVAEIGARGDAVARGESGHVYVPFALPGERVRARVTGDRARILSIETPSAERVAPACPHFTRCGGCQLQHWAEAPYLAWKQDEVRRALARRGLDVAVDPVIAAWGEGRRRAAFHAARDGRGGVAVGFMERGGPRIEPIAQCPVLAPALARLVPDLPQLAAAFAPPQSARRSGTMTLTCLATESGVDVAVTGAAREAAAFDLARMEESARLAESLDLARLTVDGETLVARRTPVLTIGRARVASPPGAFVQATLAGEGALAALVLEAVAGAKRVADLYSGLGTFALRLAEFAEVHAVEGEAAMLAALKAAADAVGGLRGVTVEARDLASSPLTASELNRFDAVVFDPPRAGARAQAEQIAASSVRRVAAVSCDPATFARDMRTLVDNGFTLTRAAPVDQFRWTAHIEVVGVLER